MANPAGYDSGNARKGESSKTLKGDLWLIGHSESR